MALRQHSGHRHNMVSSVGRTDFSKPETPEVVEYEIYRDDPKCEKIVWQPGGKRNVQYVLSTEPLGPEKAFGLKMTPTRPSEQRMDGESRGLLDSVVNIEPLTPGEMAGVMAELQKETTNGRVNEVLGKLTKIQLR